MRLEIFKKPSENVVALAVTFVLFFLLIISKMEENRRPSIESIISVSEVELASTSILE